MGLDELHGRVADANCIFVPQHAVINPFVVDVCAVCAVQVFDYVLFTVAIDAGMASRDVFQQQRDVAILPASDYLIGIGKCDGGWLRLVWQSEHELRNHRSGWPRGVIHQRDGYRGYFPQAGGLVSAACLRPRLDENLADILFFIMCVAHGPITLHLADFIVNEDFRMGVFLSMAFLSVFFARAHRVQQVDRVWN